MNQPTHYITYVLADFALEHPEVTPLLDHPTGSAFERADASEGFEAVPLE